MAKQEPRGKIYSPAADDITFYGRLGRLRSVDLDPKDYQGTTPPRRLTASGSSNLYDLSGDKMMPSMLEDMRQWEPGSIVFANHNYSLPKSVVGRLYDYPSVVEVTAVKSSPFVQAGEKYLEMHFMFDVLTRNEDAKTIYDYIVEDDLKVGTSVGVQISDYNVERDEDGWPTGLLINHGLLLEVSTVGIPCNFQSWVKSAVDGLQKQYGAPLPFDEPKELRYMARHWSDFSCDVDQLVLSRIAKRLTPKQLDFAEFDPEDTKTLTGLDEALRESGLYIERLPVTE